MKNIQKIGMEWLRITGAGNSTVAVITVDSRATTFNWELAEFVPVFLKELEKQNVSISDQVLMIFIEKFARYLLFAKDKEEAMNLTVNNYVIQLRNISRWNGAWFI